MSKTRQQRRAAQRRGQGPPSGGARSTGMRVAAGALAVMALAAVLIYTAVRHSQAAATPSASQSLAPPIDGIKCEAMEGLAYHIHQHLELYQNGKRVAVPAEIGIPGGEQSANCYYWIHVHAGYPNIIHVESPIHKTFTLGDFFDIWSATRKDAIPAGDGYVKALRAAAARGQVTVFDNLKQWRGSYRSVPLLERGVITVEIGRPVVPPKPFKTWNGL